MMSRFLPCVNVYVAHELNIFPSKSSRGLPLNDSFPNYTPKPIFCPIADFNEGILYMDVILWTSCKIYKPIYTKLQLSLHDHITRIVRKYHAETLPWLISVSRIGVESPLVVLILPWITDEILFPSSDTSFAGKL